MTQVFRIDHLRAKVLAFLRKAKEPKTVHEIAAELGLPEWAAESGLRNAAEFNMVQLHPTDHWSPT